MIALGWGLQASPYRAEYLGGIHPIPYPLPPTPRTTKASLLKCFLVKTYRRIQGVQYWMFIKKTKIQFNHLTLFSFGEVSGHFQQFPLIWSLIFRAVELGDTDNLNLRWWWVKFGIDTCSTVQKNNIWKINCRQTGRKRSLEKWFISVLCVIYLDYLQDKRDQ